MHNNNVSHTLHPLCNGTRTATHLPVPSNSPCRHQVRCNSRGKIGFLSDTRRLNVALTRAKRAICVVGHGPTLLAGDPLWARWVNAAYDTHLALLESEEQGYLDSQDVAGYIPANDSFMEDSQDELGFGGMDDGGYIPGSSGYMTSLDGDAESGAGYYTADTGSFAREGAGYMPPRPGYMTKGTGYMTKGTGYMTKDVGPEGDSRRRGDGGGSRGQQGGYMTSRRR